MDHALKPANNKSDMRTAKEIWIEEFDRCRAKGTSVENAERNADETIRALVQRGFLEVQFWLDIAPKMEPHRHVRMLVEYSGKFKVHRGSGLRLAMEYNDKTHCGQSDSDTGFAENSVEICATIYGPAINERDWIAHVEPGNPETPGWAKAKATVIG